MYIYNFHIQCHFCQGSTATNVIWFTNIGVWNFWIYSENYTLTIILNNKIVQKLALNSFNTNIIIHFKIKIIISFVSFYHIRALNTSKSYDCSGAGGWCGGDEFSPSTCHCLGLRGRGQNLLCVGGDHFGSPL